MEKFMPCSYLFVPANRPERFEKACDSGADAVIVDLEDAVPPAEKDAARETLVAWLSPEHPVLVRVNAVGSEWFGKDLALCRMAGVAGVILPKAEQVEDISTLKSAGAPAILPLIESALGFHQAQALAQCAGVQRLVFGNIDFSIDLGIGTGPSAEGGEIANAGDEEELLMFRSQLVLMSRLANIQSPVDGVTMAFDDPDRVRHDTYRARRLGFGGKLCIHPKQVTHVNEAFAPTAADINWARKVVAVAAGVGGAAVALDGKMVDRPVILKAQEILRQAMRI